MTCLTNNIINLCIQEPKPISQICTLTNKNYNTVYGSIQRAAKKGLVKTQKIDGLVWVRTMPPAQQLNLTKGTQNSNNHTKNSFQNVIPLCGPERLEAIHLTRNRINIESIEDNCYELFENYNERTQNALICLLPNPDLDFLGPPLELPYVTRFNNEGRKVEQLKHYEEAWETATTKHKRAIMITLTTDPKIQNSLWDANRKQGGNLNRLLSNLARSFEERPTYINVNEFQKNGRIHLHLVIFGKSYIMSMHKLSELWAKYGQGEIVHFHKLKKGRHGWEWVGQSPKDAKQKQPIDYLKKYLKKALYDEDSNFQYWIYNSRYFSHSRKLRPPAIKKQSSHWYVFFGVFYDEKPNYGAQYQHVIEKVERINVHGRKPGQSYYDEGIT